jgi:5-formyltetrahydrofolate cyclo-ligase
MNSSLASAKAALREQVRARLKDMPAAGRAKSSEQLVGSLLAHRIWSEAKSVLLFCSVASEPVINPLIREALASGRLTALPFFEENSRSYSAKFIRNVESDLVRGEFGILEPRSSCDPSPLNRLDLVLVPGVAFDAQGRRLGRGKGYYDRLLTQVRGTTCGVAFDEQIVAAVPVEPHDVRLNCILTPTRLIET